MDSEYIATAPSPPPAYTEFDFIYPTLNETPYIEKPLSIIIPGMGGSRIYCNCEEKKKKLYPSKLPGVIALDRHFFECTTTTTKILKTIYNISVYKNFLIRTTAIPYSYDWRIPPIKHAETLITKLRTEYKEYNKITLIGHSLGGLIIRILIEYLKPADILANIADVYICGTPFYGSYDTNDYNCELQIIPVLLQTKKQINLQHKPIILTSRDIKNMFKYFSTTLLYLAPSFIISALQLKSVCESYFSLGKYATIHTAEFNIIKDLHRSLALYDFHGINYHVFFNVSRKIDVTHNMDTNLIKHITQNRDGETHIKKMKKISQDQWEVTRSFHSDGLVLACRKMPIDAVTFFDQTLSTHALLMNSRNLSNFIIEKK